jgi:hypothetical protein
VVEVGADVIMKSALVALRCQDIVAVLIDDLLGDRALAVERIGCDDRALQ